MPSKVTAKEQNPHATNVQHLLKRLIRPRYHLANASKYWIYAQNTEEYFVLSHTWYYNGIPDGPPQRSYCTQQTHTYQKTNPAFRPAEVWSDGDCRQRVVAPIISKLPDLPLQPISISEAVLYAGLFRGGCTTIESKKSLFASSRKKSRIPEGLIVLLGTAILVQCVPTRYYASNIRIDGLCLRFEWLQFYQ